VREYVDDDRRYPGALDEDVAEHLAVRYRLGVVDRPEIVDQSGLGPVGDPVEDVYLQPPLYPQQRGQQPARPAPGDHRDLGLRDPAEVLVPEDEDVRAGRGLAVLGRDDLDVGAAEADRDTVDEDGTVLDGRLGQVQQGKGVGLSGPYGERAHEVTVRGPP